MNTINKGSIVTFKNDYSIYKVDEDSISYYLCIPNNDTYRVTMYIGISNNDLSTMEKDEIVNEIDGIGNKIFKVNPSSIYLVPVLNYDKLVNAINDNDDYFYNKLLDDLHKTTRSAYETINNNNSVEINEKILAIKDNNRMDRFIDWLDVKMAGNLDTINIRTIDNLYNEIDLEKTQIIPTDIVGMITEDTTSGNGPKGNSGGPGNSEPVKTNDVKVRRKIPPKLNLGFSRITFITLIIGMSIVFGIIAALLANK